MINIGKNNVTLMVDSEEIIEAYIGNVKIYPNHIEEIPFIPEWETGNPMADVRVYSRAVSMRGCVYIFGGADGDGYLVELVEKYDPVEDKYHYMPPMPTPRKDIGCVAIGDIAYCIGGKDIVKAQSTVEAYNAKTNTWTTLASMPLALGSHTVGVNSDGTKIYVAGGMTSSKYNEKLLIYDIASNSWSFGANIPKVTTGPKSFSYNNIFYVAGGFNRNSQATSIMQYYSISENRWGEINMPYPFVSGSISMLLDNKAYLIGGQTASNAEPMRNVNIFDPTTSSWGGGVPLRSPRMRHTSTECEGLLYVLGGSDELFSGDVGGAPLNTMEIFGKKGEV